MANVKRSLILQDDEKFTLMKFRRSVADILKPEHDDHFVVRWLRARNWNVVEAEKMLRENVKWRERWGADTIDTWKCPQILFDLCPHGVSGFDKGGSPVVIVPFAGMDMWGLLHIVNRADVVRVALQTLEKYMNLAYEQSKTHGPEARQFIVIFDMDNFNLKQYVWRPATEVVISLIKMYADNYPEILKYCYIINAPKVFAFAFNIVKKFLDDYTIGKIMIYKSDRKKWLPAILEHVDESQLPAYFGGTLTDEDGNPKCVTKINWGGKVPKSMYADREENNVSSNTQLTDTIIKKGGKLKFDFNCTMPGCVLKWEFKTYDHDIRFGIKCKNNTTGEETIEVPYKRVASHQLDEIGFISCQQDCSYVVAFDNTYSYFKNKKISYAVSLSNPLDDLETGVQELMADKNEVDKL